MRSERFDLHNLIRDGIYSVIFHAAPRLTSVALLIAIGRQTGPTAAGIFALATTYLLITSTILRGLDELIVREVSGQPENTRQLFIPFALPRVSLSLILYAFTAAVVVYGLNYPQTIALPILAIALSIVPDGISHVALAILMAHRRFDAGALATVVTSALKAIAGIIAVWQGLSLWTVSVVWLAGSVFGAILFVGMLHSMFGWPQRSDWNFRDVVARYWRPALSFLGITALLAVESQTDSIVLSKARTVTEVGWYGAATTIAFGFLTLSQAYRFAAFPVMARHVVNAEQQLAAFYSASLRYIAVVALPLVAGTVFLAPQIIVIVFGPRFQPSVLPLQILLVAFLLMFLNEPTSRMMYVQNRQQRLLVVLIIATVVNVLLNLALVPYLGAIGAAMARLCSTGLIFALNYVYVARNTHAGASLVVAVRPAVAALLMLFVIWPLSTFNVVIIVLAGSLVYALVLAVIDRATTRHIFNALSMALRSANPK